ncbi:MAG: hypothetical protein ABEI52_08615 [Halobacteriaceae archaeon]
MKRNESPARDRTEHVADVVLDLSIQMDGEDIEYTLTVLKLRGGRTPDQSIKLELADRVQVDTSRDIA